MKMFMVSRLDNNLVNNLEQVKKNFFTVYTNKRGETVSEDIDKKHLAPSASVIQIVYIRDGNIMIPKKPIQVYDYSGVKWIKEEDVIYALGFE